MTTKRGDVIPRPQPWTVKAADLTAGKGWDSLVAQHPEAADRAWVAMTSEPRTTDSRQNQLKGSLATVSVGGNTLQQWQFKATAGGRIWYAIEDKRRGTGVPSASTALREL